MVGIYKITNNINQHCYIGQSTQIQKRWQNHKIAAYNLNDKGYNYPLYKAFRKYGIENFSFTILEKCNNEDLNEKEVFWINYYHPEYNQALGGDYCIIPKKLTEKQVKQIQKILIEDQQGLVSHKELALLYHVHKDTIRDINVGRTWHDSRLSYPLHLSRFDSRKQKKINYCIDCGKEISKYSLRCNKCNNLIRKIPLEKMPITREELKKLIRTQSFVQIGKRYNVADNSIRKWCDKFNLPRTKKIINSYSDEEWNLI